MHDSVQPKWITGIEARNDPERIRLRLTVRLSLLYFVMFLTGIFLCRYTFLGNLPALQTLCKTVFAPPFTACSFARDYVSAILYQSKADMILLAVLALAGMTYFPQSVSNAVIAAHSLLFGSIGYHTIAGILSGDIPHPHANFVFFVYFFTQLAHAAILLAAAAETIYFSYQYRDAGRTLRTKQDHIAAHFVLHIISYAGMILIVHAARAILLALFKN